MIMNGSDLYKNKMVTEKCDSLQLRSASKRACISCMSSTSSSSAVEGPAMAPILSWGSESSTAAGAFPSSP